MQGQQIQGAKASQEQRKGRTGQCGRPGQSTGGCSVLASLSSRSGGQGDGDSPTREVRALLGCRAFLWDVLLDGEWTGCARDEVRALCAKYGAEPVARAFERE